VKLFYDTNDLPLAEKLQDNRLDWLMELEATPVENAVPDDAGFLFGYAHGEAYLESVVGACPGISDQPGDRDELVNLDSVLATLEANGIKVPIPKTWVIEVEQELPPDVTFPLFLRTPKSSWKRGGEQGRVNNPVEFEDEASLLRRAFGWNTPIIAREWLEIATAGKWMFGDAPQEVRTWIINGAPFAWSFHYLHAVQDPVGFPPSQSELRLLKDWAAQVALPFRTRLIAVDFVRDINDQWHFMEAGPGAAAGTGHKTVFQLVANQIIGQPVATFSNDVGGTF